MRLQIEALWKTIGYGRRRCNLEERINEETLLWRDVRRDEGRTGLDA
jgi:hypothetical protein